MPHSMTAFARQLAKTDSGELRCEIRSVNHRYLEPSFRLPEILKGIEGEARELLRNRLQRGKVEVSFQLDRGQSPASELRINDTLLVGVMDAVNELKQSLKERHLQPQSLNPLELLQWPGVLQQESGDEESLHKEALGLLQQTIDNLLENRLREGEALATLIEDRLQQIGREVAVVRTDMPEILQAQKDKLADKLNELSAGLDEHRVEQEIAILANKADVAEELDRLDTHLKEVTRILQQKGAIGRRLDFMMQELNREANTLSSKSLSSDTTQAAVNIKVLIEQMREQIQNIE